MNAALLGAADPDVEPYAYLNPSVQPCLARIDRDRQFRDLIPQVLAKFEVCREQTDEIIEAVYRLINALAIQTGVGRLIDVRLDHEQLEAISTVRFAYE